VDRSRVFVADGHPAFTDALVSLLSVPPDLDVVGATSDLSAIPAMVARLRPDVVTVDIDMDDADVVSLIHQSCPDVRIVVVTTVDSPRRAVQAIWSGAIGWVFKTSSATELYDAIRNASQRYSQFPPALLAGVLEALKSMGDPQRALSGALAAVTPREYDILLCLIEGLNRSAIAERHHLSVNTVRTHVQALLAKLHVHSTLEAVAVALDAGVRLPTAPATLCQPRPSREMRRTARPSPQASYPVSS
jgi:DNA-binding NarL/FixJ family response regulator